MPRSSQGVRRAITWRQHLRACRFVALERCVIGPTERTKGRQYAGQLVERRSVSILRAVGKDSLHGARMETACGFVGPKRAKLKCLTSAASRDLLKASLLGQMQGMYSVGLDWTSTSIQQVQPACGHPWPHATNPSYPHPTCAVGCQPTGLCPYVSAIFNHDKTPSSVPPGQNVASGVH